MSSDDLKIRARRIPEELVTQGELVLAGELFAPGCRHHAPLPIQSGGDGIAWCVKALRLAFPDVWAIVDAEIADGDLVAQRLTLSGTHQGPLCGAPATGRRVIWQIMAIFRIGADGKIAEHWSIWDQLDLLRQIGVMPIDAAASE